MSSSGLLVRRLAPLAPIALLVPCAAGQSLVRDIQLEPLVPGIGLSPTWIVSDGTRAYFRGVDPTFGSELFVSDGTPGGTGLLRDIEPGSPGSSPLRLQVVNGTLYFFPKQDGLGRTVWTSDGTTAGTAFVVDPTTAIGTQDVDPYETIEFDGQLFYTHAAKLYKSDGTAAGTQIVSTIPIEPESLTVVGSQLFFSAHEAGAGGFGFELWVTDGTTSGTTRVVDLNPGAFSSSPRELTEFRGDVYFGATDGVNKLWRSDGTAAGTEALFSGLVDHLAVLGSHLYFVGRTTAEGDELWRTDGTVAGTELVIDLVSGPSSPSLADLVVAGDTLYFTADLPGLGTELWATDGSAGGTGLVADLRAGADSSDPDDLTPFGSNLVFTAYTDAFGVELWITDGVTATLVRDIDPVGSSSPDELTVVGAEVWFAADDGVSGRELWRTDGTTAGTSMIVDHGSAIASGGSLPRNTVEHHGRLHFVADDGVNGAEPWVSDGTPGGTTMLADIFPGSLGSSPGVPVEFKDRLYFAALEAIGPLPSQFGLTTLWTSDGTPAGTERVTDGTIVPATGSGVSLATRERLFFAAASAATGVEPWVLDSPGGTPQMLLDIDPAGSSLPRYFADLDGVALFVANDGTGDALWRSDGTPGGTTIVANAVSTGLSSPRLLTRVGSAVYFVGSSSPFGNEIWTTDGTTAGTQRVTNFAGASSFDDLDAFGDRLVFNGKSGGSSVESLYMLDGSSTLALLASPVTSLDTRLAVDDRLFFTSNATSHLWVSDGTAAGTTNLVTGGFNVRLEWLTRAGTTGTDVYLTLRTEQFAGPTTKPTLWKTDGTPGGTGFLASVDPAGQLSNAAIAVSDLVAIGAGPELLLAGDDYTHGPEVWVADGTPGGVTRLSDIAPGFAGSAPGRFVRVGSQVLFVADDGVNGAELWSLPFAATGGSALDPFGAGCLGSNGLAPRFVANGPAHIGGTLDFSCVDAPSSTAALLFVSPKRAVVPVGDCTSYLGTPFFYLTARPTGLNGIATFAPNLQPDPDLVAVPLYFQWVVLDPGGPFGGAATLSDGLEVLIGP